MVVVVVFVVVVAFLVVAVVFFVVVAFLVVVVFFVVVVVVVVVVTGAAAFPTAENWSVEASRSTMSLADSSHRAYQFTSRDRVHVPERAGLCRSAYSSKHHPTAAAPSHRRIRRRREALCCPEVHIEPFARINIVRIHEVLHPGAFGRCTRQLVRNGFIAVGGVIGAVVVANQGVIDDFIRLQGFFGVLSC